MNRESIVFCLVSMAIAVAVSAIGFRIAALPADVVATAVKPVPAETLPDVELGGGFGKVSVIDLVGFYVENPPAAPSADAGAAPAAKRFGGC
ncbi:MAG TPA: hypothetical protein PK787_08335 [Burkholderiaceae bacterium]|jgi:hypothetical protein|nr:hypothetical protein [Burkholderiaceae bacterium]